MRVYTRMIQDRQACFGSVLSGLVLKSRANDARHLEFGAPGGASEWDHVPNIRHASDEH